MPKQTILEVVSPKKFGNHWAHLTPAFAFAGAPKNNKVPQLTGFMGCREDLCECLYGKSRKIPRGRLRLLVSVGTKRTDYRKDLRHIRGIRQELPSALGVSRAFHKQVATGVRLLNIMEKRHGWPSTKLYKVKSKKHSWRDSWSNEKKSINTYIRFVEASRRWIRSPHMLSLFTLILRAPSGIEELATVRSYKALKAVCLKCRDIDEGDSRHIALTFRFWDILMGDYGKMFAKLPIKYVFKKGNYESAYGEGVTKLCELDCSNDELGERFEKLVRKAGLI